MTTALDSTPANGTTCADLLLVRMALPNATPKKVRQDLATLVNAQMLAAEFDELRNGLASSGFLNKGKRNSYALTDEGRVRALDLLGVTELPPRTKWSTVVARYLFPKAAGLSAEAAAKLASADKLAAFILKRKYGLAAGSGSTVKQVIEAVACKELGFTDETTLEGVMCRVLSSLMGAERLTKQKIARQLPLFQTGLTAASADSARRKIVRDWLAGASPVPPSSAPRSVQPFDLPGFAASVRVMASGSPPEDRFHDNKVFIADLWRASQRQRNFPRLSLPEFKQRLVEANTQSLLHLSRADLVQAMDPQQVADSETEYLHATFHFVLIEGVPP